MEQANQPSSKEVSPQSVSTTEILKKTPEPTAKIAKEEVSEIPEQLFDRGTLNNIKDPFAKQQVSQILEEKEKQMVKAMNEKFRQAAEMRKQAEALMEQNQEPQWTEDTFENMLQDPKFIEFAQAKVASQQTQTPPSSYEGSQEEWSALSDSEQQRIRSLEDKINSFMTQQEKLQIQAADKEIAERLPGYDASAVDKFQNELLQNKYDQASIREHIGKSLLFDQAVQRAHQNGLEGRKLELGEKSNAAQQLNGHNTQTQKDVPQAIVNEQTGKKEPSAKHFARIALQNLAGMGKN